MFLVCGEALFDFFCEPHAHTARLGFQAVAGGSPFNVALGLRRLGIDVALLAGLSEDYLGQRLHQVLIDEGVRTEHLHRFTAPTTLAMVAVGADGSPQYSFRGDGCADRQLQARHLPTLDSQVRGIHFGSFSLVVEPIASALRQFIVEQDAQRLITLDPNVRLNPAPDIERWRERIAEFASHAHLIKVSEEDLELLYPGQRAATIAARWLQQRCQVVFVTRGRQGARFFSRRHGEGSIPAREVVTADTVGAGDTFQAALIAWLTEQALDSPMGVANLTRAQIEAMLDFAVRAAALTCSKTGPDLPYRDQLR